MNAARSSPFVSRPIVLQRKRERVDVLSVSQRHHLKRVSVALLNKRVFTLAMFKVSVTCSDLRAIKEGFVSLLTECSAVLAVCCRHSETWRGRRRVCNRLSLTEDACDQTNGLTIFHCLSTVPGRPLVECLEDNRLEEGRQSLSPPEWLGKFRS